MRGYRVKRCNKSFKVQVRFLFFWRTLAIYPYCSFPPSQTIAKKEAVAITSELIRRSS